MIILKKKIMLILIDKIWIIILATLSWYDGISKLVVEYVIDSKY